MIVTGVTAATANVVTVKVAVVAPAATVTLAGTVAAAVLLLDSATTAPPAGAAALSVTVPVDEIPPVTAAGFRLTDASVTGTGFTVSVAVCVPLYVPVIVTGVTAATANVVTVKVAVVAPAATVTLAGTVAAVVLLLDSATTAPPAGAAALSVTVPVDEIPPVTAAGFRLTDASVTGTGFTVSVAVCVPL